MTHSELSIGLIAMRTNTKFTIPATMVVKILFRKQSSYTDISDREKHGSYFDSCYLEK